MRIAMILAIVSVLSLGCARVRVEAPEKPIKVDISMRLDIYQHVQKDIDDIENIVSGSSTQKQEQPKKPEQQSLLSRFLSNAFAEELSPEVEQAAKRRGSRLAELIRMETSGILGENKSGLVEIRNQAQASEAAALVSAENSDREIIYSSVAKKNGTSVAEVEKLYAKKLQDKAPAGTPIEVLDESTGKAVWKIK